MSMTKKEALELLYDSDHAFLTPTAALGIAEAFGVKVYVQTEKVNHRDPKGLRVPGLQHGAKVQGYDAADLATDIVRGLEPNFRNPKMGRGSSLRFACEALQKYVD